MQLQKPIVEHGQRGSMIHDRPANADRLLAITLSGDDLRAARRLLRLVTEIDSGASEAAEPVSSVAGSNELEHSVLVARAHDEFRNRQRRAQLFGQSMFGEAAWDILLVLYILDRGGPRQTLRSLIEHTQTPMTTANRWLDFLVDRALVGREPHPTDRRSAFVRLAPKGREMLDLYFSQTVKTGV